MYLSIKQACIFRCNIFIFLPSSAHFQPYYIFQWELLLPINSHSTRSLSYHGHFRQPKIQKHSLKTNEGAWLSKNGLICILSFCLSILMNSKLQATKTWFIKSHGCFLHRRQSVPSLIIHRENKIPFNHFKHCHSAWLKRLLVSHLPLPWLKDCVWSLAGATREAGQPIIQQG